MARKATPRLSLYQDVQAILDQALVSGGGEVTLPNYGQAVHWRHRAYKFRKMYAEAHANSPYDLLTFKKVEEGENVVRIVKSAQAAVFKPAEGIVPIATSDDDDELLNFAKGLGDDLP